jgi:hypothetical protein
MDLRRVMMMGNDTMPMEMEMSMVMTFSDFDAYELKLLFESWDITTKTQFALSWFAVMFAVIFFHGMKWTYRQLTTMLENFDDGHSSPPLLSKADGSSEAVPKKKSPYTFTQLLVARSLLNAVIYAWALFLMLVSMTYNSSLFCALIVGYFFGDLIFQEIPKRKIPGSEYYTDDCVESCH